MRSEGFWREAGELVADNRGKRGILSGFSAYVLLPLSLH